MLHPQENSGCSRSMAEVPLSALQEAIHNLHGCESVWLESVPVKEVFRGATVWDGIVQVFELTEHPTATRCYAWSHAVEGSERRRFVAVLHKGPVDSPEQAVRAAIVRLSRGEQP